MALSPELLDDGMQTWVEFRLGVERDLFGESWEEVKPGDIPTTPLEEVIFEPPKPPETRDIFPSFSSSMSFLDRR